MSRRRPTSGLTEEMVLARLAATDHDLAAPRAAPPSGVEGCH
jgi:hypothetical protein